MSNVKQCMGVFSFYWFVLKSVKVRLHQVTFCLFQFSVACINFQPSDKSNYISSCIRFRLFYT